MRSPARARVQCGVQAERRRRAGPAGTARAAPALGGLGACLSPAHVGCLPWRANAGLTGRQHRLGWTRRGRQHRLGWTRRDGPRHGTHHGSRAASRGPHAHVPASTWRPGGPGPPSPRDGAGTRPPRPARHPATRSLDRPARPRPPLRDRRFPPLTRTPTRPRAPRALLHGRSSARRRPGGRSLVLPGAASRHAPPHVPPPATLTRRRLRAGRRS